ncbi:MAG: 1-phosphofructokinase [Lachnospiraceae bacterium]|nr:1-phosphofructokinase [Ruminococcus sp.]MCM1274573.1 1-phosphofructokinase [Lachnospiraceae bacterium]
MVYTVTFNPALDYVVFVNNMRFREVNRIEKDYIRAGGKGINVSTVLSELGVKSKAMGFVAGFTGAAIEQSVIAHGVEADFVRLDGGLSRINIKLKSDGETELNANGPDIPDKALKELFERFSELDDGDVLVLAGSVPKSLPQDIYQQILEYVSAKKIRTVVDASGELLTNTLVYKPYLIKPNLDELTEIFGEKPSSKEEVLSYAMQLRKMGAQNVLVSMAGDGALLLDMQGEVYFCEACDGKVVNSVGAGDAMVAGFVSAMLDNDVDHEYALILGTAAGGATAFTEGMATKDQIIYQMKKLLKKHAEKTV